jgi:hypothetical protein
MAKYFPPDWKDITVAFPVNILELDTIQELVNSGVTSNLLVENTEAVDYLEDHLNGTVGFYLKIDVGYGHGDPCYRSRQDRFDSHQIGILSPYDFLGIPYSCRTRIYCRITLSNSSNPQGIQKAPP